MKKVIILVSVFLVAAGIIFFSFFWPLDSSANLKGTIGGVEKAQKYRGDQPASSDVLLENKDFNQLIQSAAWQNALKDKEVMSFLASEDFSRFVSFVGDIQSILLTAYCFVHVSNGNFEKLINSQDFQNSKDIVARNLIFQISQDMQKYYHNQFGYEETMRTILLSNQQIELANLITPQLKGLFLSQDFEKFYSSAQFSGLLQSVLSNDFNSAIFTSQDFQNAYFIPMSISQDLFKFAPDLVNFSEQIYPKDELKAVLGSADFQKILANEVFRSLWMSQDFQQFVESNLIGSNNFNDAAGLNMMGDFQKYLQSVL
ncbi:MAG TPA: hypothetical protein PLD62_08695 [Candidatus Cloacimonadota bacterium]|nr:hypothetical protein [Candidatus Cloacimonadota bacterium]